MMKTSNEKDVVFEATVPSRSKRSMFDSEMPIRQDSLADLLPEAGRVQQAAKALRKLQFKVFHTGSFSISGEAPRKLWEDVFGTQVEVRSKEISKDHPKLGTMSYLSHKADTPFDIPERLSGLIEKAYPQEPPTFFESPLPPNVQFHHLRVPDGVAVVLRSPQAHRQGVTGRGVLVAMPDTGFYRHPFYAWHGYNYTPTLAPDAAFVEKDEYGHGTAEAANIFASAPDIDFVGVKMGWNAVLGFKAASDLFPAVMTCSWGYHLPGDTLPNALRPLEAAVLEAVRLRGITVCFSAGNGSNGFPAQMPDVLAIGGVFAQNDIVNGEFDLQASNYASSFDSDIYPGRHVPDVCGLVGMQPRGVYIALPVEPGDTIDQQVAAAPFPDGDDTAPNDGWAVISGTSASSPQVAGVCALMKQVQPGLSPDLIKAVLKATARDVRKGQSNHGQPAGDGHDGATGAGLVDAGAAVQVARSVSVRNLTSLPSPR
jgi:hypothetical protein